MMNIKKDKIIYLVQPSYQDGTEKELNKEYQIYGKGPIYSMSEFKKEYPEHKIQIFTTRAYSDFMNGKVMLTQGGKRI